LKIRRDILLFGAVLVAAVASGWWLLANRPGGGAESFAADQQKRGAIRTQSPSAEAFRATVCADAPCVVVEAGGLTFLFGAGSGAASGVRALGLMHPNMDAVLLPDTEMATVEGLPTLAIVSAAAGRREALKVFGPAGLLPVIDGANLMATGAGVRLSAATEGEDQGVEGRVVFDSGVVVVRGFGGRDRGTGRVYRVDFDGKSLVLAGCLAQPSDIVSAARGVSAASGVLLAGSKVLAGGNSWCTDVKDVVRGAQQARLQASLIVAIEPDPTLPGAVPAWAEVFGAEKQAVGRLGTRGARIDLSGETPRTLPAH